ncbi:MAG: efflux transporter outer membrane subunit [Proteobacteria bacterium]|nr:efflux transporter outer membrane subunit [Pseudomonadota bacterium]
MKALHTLGVLGLALGLGACTTVGPDYHLPEKAAINLPAAQGAFVGSSNASVRSEPLPANWWKLYDDATLNGLIETAFAANTQLRVASANLARAHAIVAEAESASEPAGRLSGAVAREKVAGQAYLLKENIPPMSLGIGGLAASYQLDLFGQLRRLTEAAEADADASQAAVDLVRVNIAADVARAYVEACSAGYQKQVTERALQQQEDNLNVARKLANAGRGTVTDVTRARAQVEQIRASLPAYDARRSTALYALAALTGRPPAEFPQVVASCTQVPKLSAPIPVGDGTALLKRRPDIRQAERGLASATARIGVATAALYPTVSIGLTAGLTGLLHDLGQPDTQRWGIGPLISWTIPGGLEYARIEIAKAGAEAALARFDGTVLGALRDTETALAVYARELDRNAALRKARDEAAEAARQVETLYRGGRAPYLNDLDARRSLTSADAALSVSDSQLALDQVGLFLALGGGWEQVSGDKNAHSAKTVGHH